MSALVLEPAAATVPLDRAWLRRQVESLPAWPQAVADALLTLRRDDSSVDDCARHLACDPAITARILRLANSSFYGMAGRVATVHDAVILLGRRTLGTLLTTAAVSQQFGALKCPGFDFAAFWRHAFGTAIAAQALATELADDDGQAFSAGLLHDIGRLALVAHVPAELAATLDLARADDLPLLRAEQQTLGIDHAQVGAMIAEHWQFPPLVVAAILGHHAVGRAGAADGGCDLTDLVQVADAITHALDLSAADDERVPDVELAVWERLRLSQAGYLRVFERTEQGVAALSQALAL